MNWLNSNAINGLFGALIGGACALGGTIISNWLNQHNEKKAKLREAKSKIISNSVIQYRNIEKGLDYMLLIEIHKRFIIAAKENEFDLVWSPEQIHNQNNAMLIELENIWKENNLNDIELIHNLAILQAYNPKLGKILTEPLNKFIGWQPEKFNISDDELIPIFDDNIKTSILREQKKVITLASIKTIFNTIVSILDSPELKKS